MTTQTFTPPVVATFSGTDPTARISSVVVSN